MGYWCCTDKEKEIFKIRSFRSKIVQIKSLLGCTKNKKNNILTTWNYLLFTMLLFFGFVTSGYAIDVTLKWNPNNEPNLSGYKVFYRQEGRSYDYTNPYWETTDPTCTIYDLDKTITYYFVVRAFNTHGFESGDSKEVCLEATPVPVNHHAIDNS